MFAAFDVVVAADRARGIARRGAIPWRLPGDVAHFKQLTQASPPGHRNAVIMGRKTWQTIPEKFRPLPGRFNIVISSNAALVLPAGVGLASSLERALAQAERAERVARVFVIGGSRVYADALASPGCAAIYYTRIDKDFDCDLFFPEFEHAFQLDSVMREASERSIDYRIEVWRRAEGDHA